MKLSNKQLWFSKLFFLMFLPWAFREAGRRGYDVMVTEVWRSEASARANAAKGTGIVNSNHRKKLATDLILWKNGKPVWDSEAYRFLGEKWKAISGTYGGVKIVCCWGGDFRRADGGHFSFLHRGVR